MKIDQSTIVVTGGAGLIGSTTVDLLLEEHSPRSIVIFDASHYVHRFHYDHLRAAQGTNDVVGTQQLLDRYAEIWEASAPAISANTTGL